MKLNLEFATMVAVGIGASLELSAATLRVPTDFPTIQGAINAAVNGDVVAVEPGLYVEAISFRGKGITVQSAQGPQNTAIQSPNSGTAVVTFNTSEPATAVLEGFTVRGGSVGVRIDRCVPVVRNNIIKQNGTGLTFNFASPLIQGNTIVSNTPSGGLSLVGSSTAQIVGNDISYNTDTGSGAAIEMFTAGFPVIRNNLISFNAGSGIITMVNDSPALIEQNLIIRNQAGNNGTISWSTPSGNRPPRGVINNTIAYNSSTLASGIAANGIDATTEIFNNIIYAPGNGTGIWVGGTFDGGLPLIRTNLVLSESGSRYGGIATDQSGINGNLSSDPLFADALSNDFHLLGGSPAIDIALASRAPAFDFEGAARPVDGNNDGVARPDLGVYESVDVNEVPVADPKTVQLAEDSSAQIELSGSDPDGDPLTFMIASDPSHGTLSVNGATALYTPAANFNGTDSFTYAANDSGESSAPATVTITITPVNDAPTANGAAYAVDEDTAVSITLLGYDIDGDALTFVIHTAPQHGALSGTAPNLVYTPAANFNGADSFQFVARDAELASSPATVSITVRPVNDAPTAESSSYSVLEDQAVSIILNGSDLDGDALNFVIVNGPAHGVLSGTAPNLVYTPAANYNGADSFQFVVRDAELESSPATVSIMISPANDVPTAESSSHSTLEDQALSITLTGSDPDGDVLNFVIVNGPAHGVLSGTAPNLVYTPAANFNGADSFQFVVRDAELESSPATASITIGPVNDAPTAESGSHSTLEDQALNITLTGSDPDGDLLTYVIMNGPAHGTLSGTAPNLVYTPAAGFSGADSFQFAVRDAELESAAATVSITVRAVNGAPIAESQSYATPKNKAVNITLTGTDPDGDTLSYAVVSGPARGALSGIAPNMVYTPATGFTGTDSFQFVVRDAELASSPATISIRVDAANRPPKAKAKIHSMFEDEVLNFALTGTDPDEDALSYTVLSAPAQGALGGTAPNLTYTPPANFHGTVSFTFRVSDGQASSEPAEITIKVKPVNDAPTFTLAAESITVKKDAKSQRHNGWLQNLTAGPNESEQVNTLRVTNDKQSLFEEEPSISDSGTLKFKPRAGRTGTAVVTVKATDDGGTNNGGTNKLIRTFTIVIEKR